MTGCVTLSEGTIQPDQKPEVLLSAKWEPGPPHDSGIFTSLLCLIILNIRGGEGEILKQRASPDSRYHPETLSTAVGTTH